MKRIAAAAAVMLALCSCGEIPPPQAEYTTAATTAATEADATPFGGYVYAALTERERAAYDIIYSAMEGFAERAEFPEPLTAEELRRAFGAVYLQRAELFWARGSYDIPDGEADSTTLYYRFDRAAAEAMERELSAAAKRILAGTEGMDEREKIYHIHDSIVGNCRYNGDGEYAATAYGALVAGEAQCEGYAKAIKYICDLAGIDCILISGYNSVNESHAWNVVSINGEWYNLDATWDDPLIGGEDSGDIIRRYLLVPDREIIGISHFVDEFYFTPPECISLRANYFAVRGLYADSVERARSIIESELRRAVSNKEKSIALKLSDSELYSAVEEEIFGSGEIFSLLRGASRFAVTDIDTGAYIPHKTEGVNCMRVELIYLHPDT